MAYDDFWADRIRITLKEKRGKSNEKRIMGALAFTVDDKMCVGIVKGKIMARIYPNE